MGFPVHGDLAFFHRFQKGGLRFAGGAVDFVGQKQIGVRRRARTIEKLSAGRVVHGEADDVRRQHIRRELHAAAGQIDGAAERDGQRGFAHAGHIVQQNVSPCQKRAEHMFDDRALAANGFFHFNNDGFKL